MKIEEEEPVTETTLGWTTDEVMMALLGFNKYGDDIDAISEILSTYSHLSCSADNHRIIFKRD